LVHSHHLTPADLFGTQIAFHISIISLAFSPSLVLVDLQDIPLNQQHTLSLSFCPGLSLAGDHDSGLASASSTTSPPSTITLIQPLADSDIIVGSMIIVSVGRNRDSKISRVHWTLVRRRSL